MMGELSPGEGVLAMHRALLSAVTMGDERDDKPSGMMGILLEEIAAQAGHRTGPVPVVIAEGDERLVLSADGWPLSDADADADEPPEAVELAAHVALLARWAREEADGLIDALMDTPLEQRSALVDNLLSRVDGSGPAFRDDVAALLRFIDEGLALDGGAAELSIKIQTALLDDL